MKRVLLPVVNEAYNSKLPRYETPKSAGVDVRAKLSQGLPIKPKERAIIGTGIKVHIPEGFEIQVRPRSGLALHHGVTVLNSPGTIDGDFRGEIRIILINHGHKDFLVYPGMRIAQLVMAPVVQIEWSLVDELTSTSRGVNGFGSTGNG